ncbi:MAG: phage fiber-tail adaptor protein, partial [Sphingosinicella sp.]|uniref:phage fiber-tail adaptor protein n=1 Tax=Sphingosinicella sp. TaxID=1917971 RepID=UPI0040382C52
MAVPGLRGPASKRPRDRRGTRASPPRRGLKIKEKTMSFYLKDPHSRVDYAIDWANYLDGQIIADSQWFVAPAETGGIDIDAES